MRISSTCTSPAGPRPPTFWSTSKRRDGVVVLTARNDPPSWVPEGLRDSVLTPAEAKGLEYQSVCLLDPGRLLSQLGSEEQEYMVRCRARPTGPPGQRSIISG